MNLRKIINKKYGNVNRFSKLKGLEPTHVKYWCDKNWYEMQFRTRKKICELVGIEMPVFLHINSQDDILQELPNCTRVEVIDQNGRSYVNRDDGNKVRFSIQDEGLTFKVFID